MIGRQERILTPITTNVPPLTSSLIVVLHQELLQVMARQAVHPRQEEAQVLEVSPLESSLLGVGKELITVPDQLLYFGVYSDVLGRSPFLDNSKKGGSPL